MENPLYPHFREILLDDQKTFSDFFNSSPPQISELTFTNLFMWRHYYHFTWCIWNESLCILAQPDGHAPFFLPPVCAQKVAEQIRNLLYYLHERGHRPSVQRVAEDIVTTHLSDPTLFEVTLDRNNADYVYLTHDLIALEGNKYHGKRNHINKFKKNQSYQYRELTHDLVSECLHMETAWCNLKQCVLFPSLAGEEKAIYEALTHREQLGFRGGVILINGQVEAFALGDLLNPQTAVIHVEKANPAFEGLYQLINQEFCMHEWSTITYTNREQDLGEEGLRKAKLSYHPHHLVHKYTVTLPEHERGTTHAMG